MLRVIFIASGVLTGIIGFFGAVYVIAFRVPTQPIVIAPRSTGDTTKEQPLTVEPTRRARITTVVTRPIRFPHFIEQKERLYFLDEKTATLFSSNPDGSGDVQLSRESFDGITSARWSPTAAHLLLSFNGKRPMAVYDADAQKISPLPEGIQYSVWDNLGTNIISIYRKTTQPKMELSRPDGTEWKTLLTPLPDKPLLIAPIPRTSRISYWNIPNALTETTLRTINAAGTDDRSIFAGVYGANFLWSPDGKRLLISATATRGGNSMNLGIANSNGGEYYALGLSTLVDKCTWARNSVVIYCALPGEIPQTAVMPNDYQSGTVLTTDTFWKIDIDSGKKERLMDIEDIQQSFDASDLFLDTEESFLYFRDRRTNNLYRIIL